MFKNWMLVLLIGSAANSGFAMSKAKPVAQDDINALIKIQYQCDIVRIDESFDNGKYKETYVPAATRTMKTAFQGNDQYPEKCVRAPMSDTNDKAEMAYGCNLVNAQTVKEYDAEKVTIANVDEWGKNWGTLEIDLKSGEGEFTVDETSGWDGARDVINAQFKNCRITD